MIQMPHVLRQKIARMGTPRVHLDSGSFRRLVMTSPKRWPKWSEVTELADAMLGEPGPPDILPANMLDLGWSRPFPLPGGQRAFGVEP